MTARRRGPATNRDFVAELHARRNDPDEWGEAPVQAEVSPQRGVVMSFRLPVAEFIAMQKAAKESGETVSEFIRKSIGLRLHGEVTTHALQIASGLRWGTLQATFLVPILSAGRSENPIQRGPDPDQIPRFANVTP